LRIEHRQAFLAELGRLADRSMMKDAVADRKGKFEGIPDTESAVTSDLLEHA
jgi:DNA-binding transcriptional regulator WhiA